MPVKMRFPLTIPSRKFPLTRPDVFVDELDLGGLGFSRAEPLATGRPSYHPSILLMLLIRSRSGRSLNQVLLVRKLRQGQHPAHH